MSKSCDGLGHGGETHHVSCGEQHCGGCSGCHGGGHALCSFKVIIFTLLRIL